MLLSIPPADILCTAQARHTVAGEDLGLKCLDFTPGQWEVITGFVRRKFELN